jgi:hypothetical protein
MPYNFAMMIDIKMHLNEFMFALADFFKHFR